MEIINGLQIAKQIIAQTQAANLKAKVVPALTTVLIGDLKESVIKVGIKESALKSLDWVSRHVVLPADVSLEQVVAEINELNQDDSVDGIFVQFPLPEALVEFTEDILQTVDPKKDVGGINPLNRGFLGGAKPRVLPCATGACMEIIQRVFDSLERKTALLLGDSFDLIIPLASVLVKQGAKVNIWPEAEPKSILAADIVVVEKGGPNFFKKEHFIPQTLIIDTGFYWHIAHSCGNVKVDSLNELEGWVSPWFNSFGLVVNAKIMESLSEMARSRHE